MHAYSAGVTVCILCGCDRMHAYPVGVTACMHTLRVSPHACLLCCI